ncbi:unnamed protein product [Peronospora belbahrii]|uniref:c-Myc-binding protein n=1 Tax=Peronospora belbahrii TaxID=622444 RepID=A0AAU9LFI7_9STRA|nr:unnamed protein product [Peronospora belbahrii]CAH0522495.1 unnamed protein product [Peronospora belbahrii]
MKTATNLTPDSKKEEFRTYLEKSGVVNALTKVLLELYEEGEKPLNAVDYVKRYLRGEGGGGPLDIDVDVLQAENKELKQKNAQLMRTIDELQQRLTMEKEEEIA